MQNIKRIVSMAPAPLQNKRGSALYEIILKTIVFITLIVTAISFLSVFSTYINVNYVCRRVVRGIELDGQVTSATTTLFNQLKTQTNIGSAATMEVINVSYFDYSTKKIQLRDTFSVRVRTNYKINIFTPALGPPVVVTVPLECTLTGMSEKFWK